MPDSAAKLHAVPRKEESLIEEMRAAIARDREQLAGRGSPLAAPSESSVPEPEPKPESEPARSLVARLLRRSS